MTHRLFGTLAAATCLTAATISLAATRHAAMGTLYGRAATFGSLAPGGAGPSATPMETVDVPGWSFEPGQSAYFPAVASDGTVFIANLPQTFNQFMPTACTMVITCFNRTRRACDDGSNEGAFFANLRIPMADGTSETPAGCPASTRLTLGAGGADISDLEVVADASAEGGERVVFTSGWGSVTGKHGFPAFGSLAKRDGRWTVDLAARRWAIDLHDSSPEGAAACPASGDDAGCRSLAEMAQLPRSGRLVIAQYAPPGLMVTDLSGTVLAYRTWERIPDPCVPERDLLRMPREIDVDPTSQLGDERFVVIFDSSDSRGQPLQEFRYDETARALVPVSAAVAAESAVHRAPACGTTVVTVAQYDRDGNLWVGRGSMKVPGTLLGFLKRPHGTRAALERCSVTDPTTGLDRPWGSPCMADIDTGLVSGVGAGQWSMPIALHLAPDPASGALFDVGWHGTVSILEPTPSSGAAAFTARTGVDLEIGNLEPCQADEGMRMPSKGIVDASRRALWIPITVNEEVVPDDCDFFTCDPATGRVRTQYLYRLSLDRLLDGGSRVTRVRMPSAVRAAEPFVVRVVSTLKAISRSSSGLVLYEAGSANPIRTIPWRRHCSATVCTYTAKVPSVATEGRAGQSLALHAILTGRDIDASLHTVSVIPVGE